MAWLRLSTFRIWNPMYWKAELRRVRRAGAIADWLHNLAIFSATDYDGFDEDWFWRDLESLNERFPEYELSSYKGIFEQRLAESAGLGSPG